MNSEPEQDSDEPTPPVEPKPEPEAEPEPVGVASSVPEAPAAAPVFPTTRFASTVIVLGAIGLAFSLLHDLSSVIAPIFLTVNLLIAAYPVYTGLLRIRVPRVFAALVTGLTVFVVLILGLAAIIWSVTEMVQALSQYSDQFVALYNQIIGWLAELGMDQSAVLNSLKSISPANVLDFAGGILSSTSAASGVIAVIVVAIVFMTMDLPSMSSRVQITHRLHSGFSDSITSFVMGIRRYWLVTTVFGLIVAALDGVVLVGLGVSLPLVWVVLSFITNYIPNIGFVIGLVPPALLALIEKGPGTALIVVIAYSVLNFVIQSIIQPKFTGDAVGVTPTVSFISLLLWAWVFGPVGALIALPATLAVKSLLIDSDPRLRWVNAFISNDPEGVTADRGR